MRWPIVLVRLLLASGQAAPPTVRDGVRLRPFAAHAEATAVDLGPDGGVRVAGIADGGRWPDPITPGGGLDALVGAWSPDGAVAAVRCP